MKLLAIETTTDACSVAATTGSDVAEKHVVEPRAHTRILMPMIESCLADAGMRIRDLDAVALGNGPGSFIGMRIGASVAQGICHAAGLPLIPVSSLAAVAAEVMDTTDARRVAVAQDARMNEVYFGEFERDGDALPQIVGQESIVSVGRVPISSSATVVAGAAWTRYPELIAENRGQFEDQSPVTLPSAGRVLRIAASGSVIGISAERLEPAYLRKRVAEPPVVS